MSQLLVRGIAFQSLPQPLFEQRPAIDQGMNLLTQTTAKLVDELLAKTDVAPAELSRHFLCSTMIELPFTAGAISWPQVADMLAKHGSHQPDTFVNAYECASWGYSLRHYLNHGMKDDTRYLMVTIVDANLNNLEFWRYNENWGHSGFGICSVLLEITGELTDELLITSAKTHNAMAEFATTVRRHVAKRDSVLAMPFFPQQIQDMFTSLLKGQQRLPDMHADWGHCFGSDPWLSLLLHGLEHGFEKPEPYMACSQALNGYFAMAEVMMTPETVLIMKRDWDTDSLNDQVPEYSRIKLSPSTEASFNGKITRRPFPATMTPAMAQTLPLLTENDFEVFSSLPSNLTPVKLNFQEHYKILSDMVECAATNFPEITVLCRISMPGGMRILAGLLQDNVLLLQDVKPEEEKLLKQGKPLMVVEDYFAHYELEKGDNSMSVRLYDAAGEKQALPAELLEKLAVWGIEPVNLSDDLTAGEEVN